MKRIIFCFDGTWDRLASNWKWPTNVVLTAQSITPVAKDRIVQIIHYDDGVGTAPGTKILGGMFGLGVLRVLITAYTFLVFNYEVGDDIFVFGFSRGAFTARAFVGMLRKIGILPRSEAAKVSEVVKTYRKRVKNNDEFDTEDFLKFRLEMSPLVCVDQNEDAWRCRHKNGYSRGDNPILQIRYLGVWDTVASIGVAQGLFAPLINWFTPFYNTDLTGMVVSARHALAIDERRVSFSPTLWTNFETLNGLLNFSTGDENAPYQQKWFPGGHGSVGGGGPVRGLSDAALDWVLSGAREAKLDLDVTPSSAIFDLSPDASANLDNLAGAPFNFWSWLLNHLPSKWRSGPRNLFEVSSTVVTRWQQPAASLPEKASYRPKALDAVSGALDQLVQHQTTVIPMPPSHVPVAPMPTPGECYKVVRNDELEHIAEKAYNDRSKVDLILSANSKLLNGDKNRIYVGQLLWLPLLTS